MSREAIILADLYDLQYAKSGAKKGKPYPRPWRATEVRRMKPSKAISQSRVLEALRRVGHAVH